MRPKQDIGNGKKPWKYTDKDLYHGGKPSDDDVAQDNIGDCYLDATMMAEAHAHPDKIRNLITGFDEQTGEFIVTLYDATGKPREIRVSQQDIDVDTHAGSDINGASKRDGIFNDPDAPLCQM